MSTAGKRLWLLALAGLVVGLLHAGLSPYDLDLGGGRNEVRWSETGRGLVFAGGIAFSGAPLYWQSGEQPAALSVEAWVVPDGPNHGAKTTVLGLVDDERVAPFEIAVGDDRIALRYRVREGVSTGEVRAVSFERSLRKDQLVHFAVTSGPQGTRLYVDGSAPDALRLRQPLLPARSEIAARLVLGNSAEGIAAWAGEFRGLAVFDRVLEEQEVRDHDYRVQVRGVRDLAGDPSLRALYAFDEATGITVANLARRESAIEIPRRFHALRWGVLEFPTAAGRWSRQGLLDMLRNLLGFMPFGLLMAHVMRSVYGRSVVWAFAHACTASAALSLTIELGQALLPSRHSSALDLLLNVCGGAAGAALLFYLQHRRARAVPRPS